MLISINGFYGSGGNELGYALGKDLNYTVYDAEPIQKAVKDSGLDLHRSTLAFYDEDDTLLDQSPSAPYSKALYSLQMDVLPIGMAERQKQVESRRSGLLSMFLDTAPINHTEGSLTRQQDEVDRLKFAQAKAILDAAEQGNAVFFGRCSSYILAGRKDALRIFCTASLGSCRARIDGKYGLGDEKQLDELIKKTNRRRAYYFETFTGLKWDDAENYDLCVNTDYLGFDGTLELIKQILAAKQAQA